MNEVADATNSGWGIASVATARRRWTEHTVLATARMTGLVGDAFCVLLVLHIAFILSHGTINDPALSSVLSWLYAGLGTVIFIGAFAYNGIYAREFLLDRRKQTMHLIEAWLGSSILFFGAMAVFGSVLVSFPSSLLSAFALLISLSGWRVLFQRTMRSETITRLLRQRIVILGWSESTAQLSRQTWEAFVYPCEIIGYVEISSKPDTMNIPPTIPCLGTRENLVAVLHHHQVDAVFLAGTDHAADDILELARLCQTEMVEFKVIPNCFPALVSGMHVEWVSGVPILGTDRLRLNRLHVRMEKRALDIFGALVGLLLAGPLIAIFTVLVYLESPGPVFYPQCRLGIKGRPFNMFKIRSMKMNAEKSGTLGWTLKDDPRRLKIGIFMRRWNIDELPQFWNVLKGEMSLVGPRPELPASIANFKPKIIHYNLRHSVKPGLTGWAQVNGLRGDTDVSERIRHDLFYIDNWSLLLDVQTMFLTIFKHKNACE
jgi:exopolysaccharide biosynthesis polyprenyl glycosylphosphotransferase